jgi:hypothetical protein
LTEKPVQDLMEVPGIECSAPPTLLPLHDGGQPPATVFHFQAEKQGSSRTGQLGDQTARTAVTNMEFAQYNEKGVLVQQGDRVSDAGRCMAIATKSL